MNARQAKRATDEALKKKQQQADEEARLEREQQEKNDAWSRDSAFPAFMRDVVETEIQLATKRGDKHALVETRNRIVAELTTLKLVEDEYEAHMKTVHVPEDREYGSSGEGMHDAYTTHVIHINWDGEGDCRSCREEFARSRRW